jgi:D-aminopeptidase
MHEGIVIPTSVFWPPSTMITVLPMWNGKPGSFMTMPAEAFATEYEVLPAKEDSGKVVIMADMEGISNVPPDWSAVTPAEETGGVRTEAYEKAGRSMTLDVLMAVAGARAAGAREIVVVDSHWHDTNLSEKDFDDGVRLQRGSQAAVAAMEGASALVMIGWHARAGTAAAFLAHTYTERVKRLLIDGAEVGEIGMLARISAACGVPVVFVSGDRAACMEAAADIGCLTVETKCFVDAGHPLGAPAGPFLRDQLSVWSEIVLGVQQALLTIETAALPPACPGRFDVEVHPQYAISSPENAIPRGPGCYEIADGDIRGNYSAFQRFVDELPALT